MHYMGGVNLLDVCLLGTGGMMPLPNRYLTALLVRNKGKMILIDCGEGTQVPLKLIGWGFKNIDAICFTHYHADHVAGLPGLLLTIGNSGRVEPLTILGPPGLKEVVNGMLVIAPELPFKIELVELSDDCEDIAAIDDFLIHSIPAEHSIPCLSYSIEIKRTGKFNIEKAQALDIPKQYWNALQKGETVELNGKIYTNDMVLGEERKGLKVSYCTDTRPTDFLNQLITNSDLLVCEGMYGEDEKIPKAIDKKHMTFSEAATLAKNANVKELWLTHYSPALVTPEEYIHFATEIFENTKVGYDLMNKSLVFEDE